ncbi:unnamed protein product [Plutella xylostella]|uniref:(diamondback moth) hypothetical protein n=1 Tax=Plutella xylostella TaxID=51655 RepID=A0A8S4F982_PLUXY|nr:unnamed protein product [Plutella xylostella]
MDGSNAHVLTDDIKGSATGLALAAANDRLYYVDKHIVSMRLDNKGSYKPVNMDGSNAHVLTDDIKGSPTGLALDTAKDRLYYVDKHIVSMRLDNKGSYIFLNDALGHPYSLAVFENSVYWSDWTSNTIQVADKVYPPATRRRVLLTLDEPVFGIHIYHPILLRQTPSGCSSLGCSDLCLLRGRGAACACHSPRALVTSTSCAVSCVCCAAVAPPARATRRARSSPAPAAPVSVSYRVLPPCSELCLLRGRGAACACHSPRALVTSTSCAGDELCLLRGRGAACACHSPRALVTSTSCAVSCVCCAAVAPPARATRRARSSPAPAAPVSVSYRVLPPCSELCLLRGRGAACACHSPRALVTSTSCAAVSEDQLPEFLIVGGGAYFTMVRYNSLGNPEARAAALDIGRVHAMAYDNNKRTLYIYDGQRKTINYIGMNEFSRGVTRLLEHRGLDNVMDMGYDYVSKALYFVDAGRRTLEVISLVTSQRAVVHRFERAAPISLCVLSEHGCVYRVSHVDYVAKAHPGENQ